MEDDLEPNEVPFDQRTSEWAMTEILQENSAQEYWLVQWRRTVEYIDMVDAYFPK